MANRTNEQLEAAAITAKGFEPYDRLVPPYPVWAAAYACGMTRTDNDYKDVASELFYETCINLDDTA